MKVNFKRTLSMQKEQQEKDAILKGVSLAMLLYNVAANNIYGFGPKRLDRLNDEVMKILNEECINDPEMTTYRMEKRVKQIYKIKD